MLMLLFIVLFIESINIVYSLPLFWIGGVKSDSAKICIQVKK